jgi:hypothetical protein
MFINSLLVAGPDLLIVEKSGFVNYPGVNKRLAGPGSTYFPGPRLGKTHRARPS